MHLWICPSSRYINLASAEDFIPISSLLDCSWAFSISNACLSFNISACANSPAFSAPFLRRAEDTEEDAPDFLDPDLEDLRYVVRYVSWCNPSCDWVSACFHHATSLRNLAKVSIFGSYQSSVSFSFNSSGNNISTASCASLNLFRNNWNVYTASSTVINSSFQKHEFYFMNYCDNLPLRIELSDFIFSFSSTIAMVFMVLLWVDILLSPA